MCRKVRFSVIVSIYNVERYLRDCLNSILEQKFKNYELILIIDGSEDRCIDICKEYKNKFEKCVIIEQENMGLAKSRNMGIDIAYGEYLIFIDPDDLISKDTFFDLNRIVKASTPDVIIGHINYFQDIGVERVYEEDIFDSGLIENCSCDLALKNYYKTNVMISPACRYITKKQMIKENNIYFLPILFEDVEWSTRMLVYANKIRHYNKKFYNYRLRNDSLSTFDGFMKFDSLCQGITNLCNLKSLIRSENKLKFINSRCNEYIEQIEEALERFGENEKSQLMTFLDDNKEMIADIRKNMFD